MDNEFVKMARNEEKQLGRLNRLWLHQLNEEQAKKTPPRPGLGSLNTASEVKKWLPTIKRDIDFYLKQSQVACYPERQIEEFSLKISQLTNEYKAYVRKLRELEPGLTAVPWTDRSYSRKRKLQEDQEEKSPASGDTEDHTTSETSEVNVGEEFHSLLSTPILDRDSSYTNFYGHEEHSRIIYNSDPNKEDAPLEFSFSKNPLTRCDKVSVLSDQIGIPSAKPALTGMSAESYHYPCNHPVSNEHSTTLSQKYSDADGNHLMKTSIGGTRIGTHMCTYNSENRQTFRDTEKHSETALIGRKTSEKSVEKSVSLNLPYSDSSDDEG